MAARKVAGQYAPAARKAAVDETEYSKGEYEEYIKDEVLDLFEERFAKGGDNYISMAQLVAKLSQVPDINAYFAKFNIEKKGKHLMKLLNADDRFNTSIEGPGQEAVHLTKAPVKGAAAPAPAAAPSKPVEQAAAPQGLADYVALVFQGNSLKSNSADIEDVCNALYDRYPMFKNNNPGGFKEVIRAALKTDDRFQVSDNGRVNYGAPGIVTAKSANVTAAPTQDSQSGEISDEDAKEICTAVDALFNRKEIPFETPTPRIGEICYHLDYFYPQLREKFPEKFGRAVGAALRDDVRFWIDKKDWRVAYAPEGHKAKVKVKLIQSKKQSEYQLYFPDVTNISKASLTEALSKYSEVVEIHMRSQFGFVTLRDPEAVAEVVKTKIFQCGQHLLQVRRSELTQDQHYKVEDYMKSLGLDDQAFGLDDVEVEEAAESWDSRMKGISMDENEVLIKLKVKNTSPCFTMTFVEAVLGGDNADNFLLDAALPDTKGKYRGVEIEPGESHLVTLTFYQNDDGPAPGDETMSHDVVLTVNPPPKAVDQFAPLQQPLLPAVGQSAQSFLQNVLSPMLQAEIDAAYRAPDQKIQSASNKIVAPPPKQVAPLTTPEPSSLLQVPSQSLLAAFQAPSTPAMHSAFAPPPTSSAAAQSLTKSRHTIFAPFMFADSPNPLPYTVRENSFTVEFEIAIFGLEVKGVQFANRSLMLTLGALASLTQSRFHLPMGSAMPTTLVFTSPDGFADAINFVPSNSVLLVRFGRLNPL